MRFLRWYWRLTKKAFPMRRRFWPTGAEEQNERMKEEIISAPKEFVGQLTWAIITSAVLGSLLATITTIADYVLNKF